MYAMRDNNYIKSLLKDILFLQGFKSWVKKEEPEYSEAGYKALDERLVLLKRELRNEYRRRKYESERKRVYRGFGYDESITTFFEEYFDSKEEAEEWAEEEYRAGQIYADYSPTGKWFISDIRIAHIEGNRWRVMIRESLDC